MGKPFHFEAIAEAELYKFAPWDLPGTVIYSYMHLILFLDTNIISLLICLTLRCLDLHSYYFSMIEYDHLRSPESVHFFCMHLSFIS
ncbi:hypothetical protein BHE74_00005966 [Ensete ventricosum]|nr:hypothetical protein BHE74_00005966 [Ensete ventricosum]